jgi:hypothetical protein
MALDICAEGQVEWRPEIGTIADCSPWTAFHLQPGSATESTEAMLSFHTLQMKRLTRTTYLGGTPLPKTLMARLNGA